MFKMDKIINKSILTSLRNITIYDRSLTDKHLLGTDSIIDPLTMFGSHYEPELYITPQCMALSRPDCCLLI